MKKVILTLLFLFSLVYTSFAQRTEMSIIYSGKTVMYNGVNFCSFYTIVMHEKGEVYITIYDFAGPSKNGNIVYQTADVRLQLTGTHTNYDDGVYTYAHCDCLDDSGKSRELTFKTRKSDGSLSFLYSSPTGRTDANGYSEMEIIFELKGASKVYN